MKVLFIYNEQSADDRDIFNQAYAAAPESITFVELSKASPELRNLIRDTPAIIPITDDLQGQYIKGTAQDGSLLALATIKKWQDAEEQVVHNKDFKRLDTLIKETSAKAVDDYTIELLTEGVM